jgi:hypothetical protein
VHQAKPADKDQYNFTDPESRLMQGSDGLVQGYNAQAAVEPVLQLIVGQSVTPAANDKEQIEPMVQVIEQISRPASRNMTNTASRARADRYPSSGAIADR